MPSATSRGARRSSKRLGDDAYTEVLAVHRRLVRETFAAHDGQEIDTQGDAFFYSFPRFGDLTRKTIEDRVLAELNESFLESKVPGEGRSRRRDRSIPPGSGQMPPPVPKPSMADEIAQLQELRDSGAITDEQYAKAVDRAIERRD